MTLQRSSVWGSWILLAFLVAVVAANVSTAQDFDRRLTEQEAVHAEQRLTRLETRLDGIQNVAVGILIIVGAQLILSGMNVRSRSGDRR